MRLRRNRGLLLLLVLAIMVVVLVVAGVFVRLSDGTNQIWAMALVSPRSPAKRPTRSPIEDDDEHEHEHDDEYEHEEERSRGEAFCNS